GRPSGACECYNKEPKFVYVTSDELGSGSLSKNGEISADIHFPIQAETEDSVVRYDTAVFTYSYKDSNGDTITPPPLETPIKLVGADAPNFCSLQILGIPYFRCTLGGDYVGAKFTSDPKANAVPLLLKKTPSFTMNVDVFGNVDARATGGVSSGQNTKYLTYELRNALGTLVATNKPQNSLDPAKGLAINSEGDKPYSVGPSVALSENMFVGGSATSVFADGISYNDNSKSASITQRDYAKQRINPTTTKILKEPNAGTTVALVFVFKASGAYDVYRASQEVFATSLTKNAATEVDGKWGFFGKALAAKTGDKIVPLDDGKVTNNALSFTDSATGAQFTIGFLNANQIPEVGGEIFVRYQKASSLLCDPNKVELWKATFELFDSKKSAYGGFYVPNFAQPAQDAEGVPQKREKTVEAVCSETYAGGTASAWPTDYPAQCETDGVKTLTTPCYCGTRAEADALAASASLNPNCGDGNMVNQGKKYCYSAGSTAVCDDGVRANAKVNWAILVDETGTYHYSENGLIKVPEGKYALFAEVTSLTNYTMSYDGVPVNVALETGFEFIATGDRPKEVSIYDKGANLGEFWNAKTGSHTIILTDDDSSHQRLFKFNVVVE
ncbi:MAG: hypothetical protein AABY01_04290, partial [Nanoarchaeota archaeon]